MAHKSECAMKTNSSRASKRAPLACLYYYVHQNPCPNGILHFHLTLHLIARTQSATVNLQSGYLQQWTFATMDISQHIQIPSGYLPEQTIARMEICTNLCIPELQKASIQTTLNTLLHAMQIPIITTAEFDRNFYSEFYLNGF